MGVFRVSTEYFECGLSQLVKALRVKAPKAAGSVLEIDFNLRSSDEYSNKFSGTLFTCNS